MCKVNKKKDPKYSCRSILDIVPIPIFEVDENHIITLANREAHKRWSSIVENKSFFYEVLFSMGEKPGGCVVEKTFKLKKPQSAEIETKKGEAFNMKTNYIEEEDSARVVIHILDMTERMRVEERTAELANANEDLLKEIAERKRAERELHEKEERYHALFELSPSGILLEDSEGNVIDANPAFCESLGYAKEEIIGKKVHMFTHPDVLHEVDQHIDDLLSGKILKYAEKSIKKDGTTCYMNLNEKKVTLPDGRDGIICVTEDFTERTKMEEKIKVSLREKEILLKEIHHRVKNNLQTISSLLSLQSQYIKDEQAQEVFKNSQERIRAMALIHEKLYESRDLSKIDFQEYIQNLVLYLFDSYSLESEKVRLKMQVEDVALNIETAIPLGLIINELVSNSFKYAFPGNRKGELHVNLGKGEDEEYDYDYTLIVKDNGIGFPEGLDFQNSDTLGMLLVNTLVTQLHGIIELNRKDGTRFTIKFKELKYKKRG